MPNINPAWKLTQLVPIQMWELISEDAYKKYYDEVNNIYESIASDNNEDVFIYEEPQEVLHFPNMDIAEDMSNGMNKAIALYYGKKSVQFVSEPVCVQSNGQKNIRISPEMIEGQSGYMSIFKIDNTTQQTEVIQVLQPLNTNKIISASKDESGRVVIYIFADNEGKTQIGEMKINY